MENKIRNKIEEFTHCSKSVYQKFEQKGYRAKTRDRKKEQSAINQINSNQIPELSGQSQKE